MPHLGEKRLSVDNAISIQGLDALIIAFSRLPEEAVVKLTPTVQAAGGVVLGHAEHNALNLNGTGQLSRSLYFKMNKNKSKYVITGHISWGKDVSAYAAPLELGHLLRRTKGGYAYGSVAPRPWLRPAADTSRPLTNKMIEEKMGRILDEMGGQR